ncbi:MAG: hypothetical protein DMG31_11255 [Acidobacteria bacterium]|nr:MAG: hypothetical protein DMG31_11255 [Acidobacteriota bacterium]
MKPPFEAPFEAQGEQGKQGAAPNLQTHPCRNATLRRDCNARANAALGMTTWRIRMPPGRRRYEKATDTGPKPFEAPFGTQGKQGKPALRSRRLGRYS